MAVGGKSRTKNPAAASAGGDVGSRGTEVAEPGAPATPDDTAPDDTGIDEAGIDETGPDGDAAPEVILRLSLDEDAPAERLDAALARRLGADADLAGLPEGGLSRSRIKALVLEGRVAVDGATVDDPARRVNAGARLLVALPAPVPAAPAPEAIPLVVPYEDAEVIVVDKPAGMVVHPAAGHGTGTLVNALLHHCGGSLSGIGGVARPGIVHRLDKDTSGVMVVAKTDRAHKALAAQFADHGRSGPLERAYLAVVWGAPRARAGTIDLPLGRSRHDREAMAVIRGDGGREAITHYEVVASYGDPADPIASLVECRLETGRTHQIRVHMTHLGHPLLGDPVYGTGFRTKADRLARLSPEAAAALAALGRQALHAALLAFAHPARRKVMRFESPLPADMSRLVAALEAIPSGER